jgi:hypothetical protein
MVRGEWILTAVQRNAIRIHTNERNYLGVVVYSAFSKEILPSGFPCYRRKSPLEGRRGLLVRYLRKKNVGTFQFKLQGKKNILKHVVLCNIP